VKSEKSSEKHYHSGMVTGERLFEITGVNPKKYLTPRNAQNVAN